MSYDLGVWYPSSSLSDSEAARLYIKLCEGDTSVVTPHPAIESFYTELTGIHPEIDNISEDEIDECPWNVAFDRSPGHVIMCCDWSKCEYCLELVQAIAHKHGLALFDPQSETIVYPNESSRDASQSKTPWWRFW